MFRLSDILPAVLHGARLHSCGRKQVDRLLLARGVLPFCSSTSILGLIFHLHFILLLLLGIHFLSYSDLIA